MSTNSTVSPPSNSIIVTLSLIQNQYLTQLPLIFTILGLTGFIGNTITFLQPALRTNTFCIYSLSGSIVDIIFILSNLLPTYFYTKFRVTSISSRSSLLCKLYIFFVSFLPQLSINLLVLSLIDQYARTCSLTSRIRRLNQIKMVPWMIGLTISFTCLTSIRAPILYDLIPNMGCVTLYTILNGILYTIFNGVLQPIVMLIFVLCTYRNLVQSHRRVMVVAKDANRQRNQFIRVAFIQVLATGCLALSWIIVYVYNVTAKYNLKSDEQAAIERFAFVLLNNIYYVNNIKSFFLCTLTSRLLRKTFIEALFIVLHKCLPVQR